jgi:hypothetical protein
MTAISTYSVATQAWTGDNRTMMGARIDSIVIETMADIAEGGFQNV